MAVGDQTNILGRITSGIPQNWFPGIAPIITALHSGFAGALSAVYGLIQYAQAQTRIATATGGFLDLISFDFFLRTLPRKLGEADSLFRLRILSNLLREKATRNGMISTLTALTGRAPSIIEVGRPLDTGAYNIPNSGYSVAGVYGSITLTAQAFITAYRPSTSGIPYVAGYGATSAGYSVASRGEYASLADVNGAVTDADIYAAVDATKAAGTEMWVQISS